MNREKLDAILQELVREAPLNDLNLLDDSLRVETLEESLINELARLSRKSESSTQLTEELRKAYPAEDFWNQLEKRLNNLLRPYQETAFLRDMGEVKLKNYLLETFEGMIRYQEPWSYLSEHLGVDEEQLKITYRVQNTLIQWVVEGRYSKRYFRNECESFFQWPDALSDELWELLTNNRAMLVERTLLKVSREIERTLDKTSSFLDGFDDDFDFDVEEFDNDANDSDDEETT